MILPFRFLIFSLLLHGTLNDIPKDKSIFISPVKINQLLSANFGELRIDHFHSGLDIKTQGVTGKEVIASASGYIYRITISSEGFGKALYIRHSSGYSTVYGHLERFTPEIEEFVRAQQYERKSFAVTLFPTKDKFPVEQGDLIAFSGNSGSSSGPHLHYEVRKTDTERPVNPLLFDFGIRDNIRPVIEKLVIYPVDRHTLINKKNTTKKINVSGGSGDYFIPKENEISISGLAGFGIKTYDLLNDSYNKCAVYSIELSIDSTSIFKYVMEGFSFDESRYVNSHIDYETYMREKMYIERTYILPDDRLSAYKNVINRGVFDFNDGKSHIAEIVVTDASNNKSSLSFKVKAGSEISQAVAEQVDMGIKTMPYNRSNKFSTEDISVSIPSGALYDTLYFTYKKEALSGQMLSDLHYVHNIYTPVHKAYTLSIKPTKIPPGKEAKMLIVRIDEDQKKSPLKSSWSDGYVSTEALFFGRFYAGIDTTAPEISANGLTNDVNLTGKKEIRIKITDDLSGIKSYTPSIDNNWALFEYDKKNDLLIYRFDESRIKKGTKHSLSLKVTDNKDNVRTYSRNFSW
jgi:hypothetical protein